MKSNFSFASNATLAEIQYMLLRAPILIGDIWRYLREEKLLVFLPSRLPFEGILFWRRSTNIIRVPSWAFNGSTVCIPERRVSADTLISSCNRVALRKSIPLSHRSSLASPSAFLRFVCRIASLRDRLLQARRRRADASKDRRRYSAVYGCGE